MAKTAPIRGLLYFQFQASRGNALPAAFIAIAAAVVSVITGNLFIFNMSLLIAMASLPLLLVTTMASKNGLWERYQLSMPIKRGDLLAAQYITIAICALFGWVLATIVFAANVVLHPEAFGDNLFAALTSSAHAFSTPLWFAGLCFPLASSKIGKGRDELISSMCLLFAVGINVIVPMLSERLDFAPYILPLSAFGISAVVFIISYFITRNLYHKMDF
ncbi:MAG: ABC-2 transporter permease [Defluviitaleaceae bacterium]|nr:ABC-2 transporter permease [Defluviitaleaceae bacterium]